MRKGRPFYKSTKKLTAVVFLINGTAMAWLSFFVENPNSIPLISVFFGTGLTLLGMKSATGILLNRVGKA